MLGSQRLGVMIARVVADDVAPELEAGAVRVRDADDPVSTNRIPQLSGRLPANTMAPIAAQDQELRDVEIVGIRCRRRSPGDEREVRDLAAARDEKCIRLRPVARQLLVSESSIGTEPYGKDLAHVMDVELEQIGQERGRLWPNSVDADQFRFPQSILLKLTKPGIEVGNLWLYCRRSTMLDRSSIRHALCFQHERARSIIVARAKRAPAAAKALRSTQVPTSRHRTPA